MYRVSFEIDYQDDCPVTLDIMVSTEQEALTLASLVKPSEMDVTVSAARPISLDEAIVELQAFSGPSFRALRKRLRAARSAGIESL